MSSAFGSGSRAFSLGATAAVSLALHTSLIYLASRLEPRRPSRQVPAVVDFEVEEERPPQKEEPPRAEPAPRPEPERPRVAMAKLKPPPKTPPPRLPTQAPPPPNEEPTQKAVNEAPAAAPRVGISLSSTASGGSFAVGVGNTLYGKAKEVAGAPSEVKPYSAEGTQPPKAILERLSSQPRLMEQPPVPYPEAARKAGVEGKVRLLLHIDANGRVTKARVLVDPGAGLGEAARQGALGFRFSPGLLEGEPVEVPDFPYTYTFVLE